ncbi:MAG: DUF1439 domain-containing protein [Phycisphaerales bacterium]|nr:MAG: DUF1439 domain-containing protein [Phycisphaerales bacterium]
MSESSADIANANEANGGDEQPTRGSQDRSPRRIAPIGAAFLAILVLAAVYFLKGRTYVIQLTEQQIRENLDATFPMQKRHFLVIELTFSEPNVALIEGSDRISFGLKAEVNFRIAGEAKQLGGTAAVTAGLRYNPDDYSFYLDSPTLDELVVQGIPVEYVERINMLASELAQDRINRTPVYTLERTDLKQLTASLILKELTVKDGKLVITLGI